MTEPATGPRLLFDIETDGLEDAVSTIHCIVTVDLDTFEYRAFVPSYAWDLTALRARHPDIAHVGLIPEGLAFLATARYLAGHNILGYDVRVIDKLHPGAIDWSRVKFMDTLVASRVIFPNVKDGDHERVKEGSFPPRLLFTPHGLEAWGYRLGEAKGDYSAEMKAKGLDPWAAFNVPMLDYCIQDVRLNLRLWKMMRKKKPDPRAIELEMETAQIILQQERNGFPFDERKAEVLYAELAARRAELLYQCEALFPPWWIGTALVTTDKGRRMKRPEFGTVTVRRFHKTSGKELVPRIDPVFEEYVAGTEHTKVRLITFNPSSRDHVADRFQKLYGWKPTTFGKDGKPTLDDEVLSALPYPPAKLLSEFYLLEKRLGAVAEGKQAWLKKAKRGPDGVARLHGRCNPNGAVSGRATHSEPNLANIPSIHNADGPVPYGRECRELFTTVPGWVLVGADASGLELRGLGHALFPYDGGAYAKVVVGGDVHTMNQKAAGLATRDQAKRFVYAMLYGSGGFLLGQIAALASLEERNDILRTASQRQLESAHRHLEYLGIPVTKKNVALTIKGERAKRSFFAKTPALKSLVADLEAEFKATGTLIGLDGRILYARSKHSLLNLRLQSDGAIICKRWMVESHRAFKERGWKNGVDFMQSAWVHDETQTQARPEIADELGQIEVECVAKAGVYFDYKCPLSGEYKVGATWADTH
ncbi:DNA polymerase [Phenylobacterium sp.]|uniref:DNA polymerase n=1 Tax=Phenylobacterium sp. TaxID=1871053 RepID=UPI00273797B4|nr:DNA polymerase [Phenylobacterium sp.]MDP3869911.1 DNA polymerase [Phenylobacterium sp.]